MIKRIILSFFVLIFLVGLFFFVTSSITKYTGLFVTEQTDQKNEFLSCLENKDITVYINTRDTSESLRNLLAKDYLSSVKIINCAWNNERCVSAGIVSFPSWIIEGKSIARDLSTDELSTMSGCLRV